MDDSALGRRNLLLLVVEAFPKDEVLQELLRAELAGPASRHLERFFPSPAFCAIAATEVR